MEEKVTIARALEILHTYPILSKTETIPIRDAHNRILAEDIFSLVDNPPFDNSSVDGWAVLASDDQTKRVEISPIFAGEETPPPLKPGQAIRIMTGAPIPPNADALVMVEDGILGQARPNFIRRKGENIEKGNIALTQSSLLTPSALALLTSVGHASVCVFSKPKISIIPTGDELISPGEKLESGQIYESNSISLTALVTRAGGKPSLSKPINDDLESLRKILDDCASSSDLILTSGGVSMGDRDYIRKLLIEEGEPLFWKVGMKPGGPPIFGMWKGTPLLGLPGNPVSSHVVFLTLVVPWISHSDLFYRKIRARLKSSLKGTPNKTTFRRIKIHSNDEITASTETHQGSGNIVSMVAHDALSVLPPNIDGEIDELIDALWLID
jgi:molybdopterin molybdotransferase